MRSIPSTTDRLNKLSSTFGDNAVAKPDELRAVINGAPLLREAELGGHPAEVYAGPIKNYAGQPVGVLEIIKDTTEYEAAFAASQRNLILGTVAILAAAILLASCSDAACRGRSSRSPRS